MVLESDIYPNMKKNELRIRKLICLRKISDVDNSQLGS